MKSSSKDRQGAFASRPSLARLVSIKRFLARLVLVAEQVLPLLVPVLSVIALYLCAAWFGIFRVAPDWVRLTMLLALAIAFVASLLPFRRLRWPDAPTADRMLEVHFGLKSPSWVSQQGKTK